MKPRQDELLARIASLQARAQERAVESYSDHPPATEPSEKALEAVWPGLSRDEQELVLTALQHGDVTLRRRVLWEIVARGYARVLLVVRARMSG